MRARVALDPDLPVFIRHHALSLLSRAAAAQHHEALEPTGKGGVRHAIQSRRQSGLPGHGVGVIKRIESRKIGGTEPRFLRAADPLVRRHPMVPTTAASAPACVASFPTARSTASTQILRSPGKVSHTTWNRRFREFNDKLRTGSVADIAEVLRDLCSLRGDKDLSYGEKKMMDKALSMLVAEISAAAVREPSEVESELNQLLMPQLSCPHYALRAPAG